MIKSDSVLYRASCDDCNKISHMLATSANKAKGDVLNLEHSAVGRPWVEIDGKLYCDECGIRKLGTEGYFTATSKYLADTHSTVTK